MSRVKAQRNFILRVPATHRGKAFIEDLKEYLNTNTYKLKNLRYSGKRMTSFHGHTRMDDADTIRVYLKDKRKEDSSTNLQELVHEIEHFRHKAEAAEEKLNTLKAYISSMQVHLQS